MPMSKEQILAQLKKFNTFLITAHINPEGDAIASQLAMAHMLRKMGKQAVILNADEVPKLLRFLPGAGDIRTRRPQNAAEVKAEAVVVLDCPTLDRTGWVQEYVQGGYVINIDHHISNKPFGSTNWVDPHAAAAGEMVYQLFEAAEISLDEESALCLYTAIMTDTGSFRFSNITSETHRIAASLMHFPLQPERIYERIYEVRPYEALRLLGEMLAGLESAGNGRIMVGSVTNDMRARHAVGPEDTEHFIDMIRTIEGSEVVCFLRELNDGQGVKISLRSKNGLDVNKIAQSFGGGGHLAAAGCRIQADMATARTQVIEAIRAALAQE